MGSGKDFDTKIYFITDSTGFAEDEFMWRVESALQGGVNIMQLREKNRTTREYILLADKVHIIAKKYNVLNMYGVNKMAAPYSIIPIKHHNKVFNAR